MPGGESWVLRFFLSDLKKKNGSVADRHVSVNSTQTQLKSPLAQEAEETALDYKVRTAVKSALTT